MRRIISGILVLAILWALVSIINKENNPEAKRANNTEESANINFKRPSFSLKGLDGKEYSTSDVSVPLVINFWASWCGPCKIEGPELVRLYKKYDGKVQIYAVNLTTSDSIEGARSFAAEYGFKFPVLLDTKESVSKQYNIQAIPTTYFVNKQGIIVDKITGFSGTKDLEEKFKKLAETGDNK